METTPTTPPQKEQARVDLLEGMISIPVSRPVWLNQCGTWSVVYPPEYTKLDHKSP